MYFNLNESMLCITCFFLIISETGYLDDDVDHNGFYSPELGGDDDCSSHASSSDWTPQPRFGMSRWWCLYLTVISLFRALKCFSELV